MPRPSERGSVLLLFPVGILAVVVMAAMAVDASIAFLGEREMAGAVAAAANDAAGAALSNRAFYRRGTVELDGGEVARVAEARVRTSLDGSRYRGLQVRAWVIRPSASSCGWALRVEASASVRYVFAPALPGGSDEARVDAGATSRPVREGVVC